MTTAQTRTGPAPFVGAGECKTAASASELGAAQKHTDNRRLADSSRTGRTARACHRSKQTLSGHDPGQTVNLLSVLTREPVQRETWRTHVEENGTVGDPASSVAIPAVSHMRHVCPEGNPAWRAAPQPTCIDHQALLTERLLYRRGCLIEDSLLYPSPGPTSCRLSSREWPESGKRLSRYSLPMLICSDWR